MAHQGWRELRIRLDRQFRQRFPMRTHNQKNDKVWWTSRVLGNLQCSMENLQSSLSDSGRLRGFLIAAYGSAFRPVIEWVEDQDNVSKNEAFDRQFGGSQGTSGVGRKWKLRYCSWSGTIRSGSIETIGPSLGSSEWRKAQSSITADLGSRSMQIASGATTTALDDDIKTAALEALVPGGLEQHLATNRARLITYEQFRSEIHAFRSQFALKTVASKITADPKEVEKGDGKNVNKECQYQNQSTNPIQDVVCWYCGKKGHLSTECCSNLKNQSSTSGTQKQRR